ncbi:hypothetical protein [Streptomyces sp. NBC_00102]|uniref:hypothetical protein n=1 Tax=Streptomyces sp. NBC_00102 TaxID=2975652 RepID=UPI002256A941|nr:hypothetical protein [Streptomyces sp. NBC_00102]MCX5397725.1 hypothetical protein [Streptomyces sp. NBC_00102]
MPGQAKRKRRLEAQSRRVAARTAPELGRWEVVLETTDEAELRAYLRGLREAGVDGPLIEISMLCGRLEFPTTHQVKRFLRHGAGEPGSSS